MLVDVKIIVNTKHNNIGDIRTITPERARVWVNDFKIAEYVEKKKGKKGVNYESNDITKY